MLRSSLSNRSREHRGNACFRFAYRQYRWRKGCPRPAEPRSCPPAHPLEQRPRGPDEYPACRFHGPLEQRTAQFERDAMGEGEGIDFASYQERPAWRPIGTVSLFNIDHRNGCADFGILIGEPGDRGKGYGTEATRLTLDYAFTALGLRNVGLTVAEWNVAGRRAYARAGFKEFGRHRSCRRLAGRWWDDIHMDALAAEFAGPTLAAVLPPDMPR